MTDEEIKKLAKEIVNQRGGFHVEAEDHYKQHQRLDRMLDLYDSASNIIIKTLLGLAVGGLIFLAAVGMGLTK
jgi:hypothetical protein